MPPKPPPRPVDSRPPPAEGADPGASILKILARHARDRGGDIAFRFLPQKGAPETRTYAELDRRARSVAAGLVAAGLSGERVLLLHPAGLPFVEAFFGCLYAGAIAVPAFPPRANRTLPRLGTMAADSTARAALTSALLLERSRDAASSLPSLAGLSWIASDDLATSGPATPAGSGREPSPGLPAALPPDSCAYLQYTSGSTSDPKGVVITHRNVIANSRAIRDGLGHDPNGRSLSWLPHFHDMGLIDGVIQPVYSGEPGYLMDPMTFLQDPSRWLAAISEHRITRSGGPNFAYDLCLRRVAPDPQVLDLRSWEVAYNGAEPVRAETLRGFAERFAPCGFRPRAFYPAYGLAEATLKVTTSVRGAGATIRRFRRASLETGQVQTGDADLDLVGAGWTAAGTTVRIVDPETHTALGDDHVGEIWVGGDSVAAGYWENEEATRRTFGARIAGDDTQYLRTGDLGFLSGGELFVTGRRKDLIIVRGRNLYPQDLEQTAEGVGKGVRTGGAAAFGVERAGAEAVVLVVEMERRAPADPAPLLAAIRTAIVETHEVDPAAIVLTKPFSVPRTSSGKVRRAACRQDFLADALPVLAAWRAPEAPGPGGSPAGARTPGSPRVRAWLEAHLAAKLGIDVDSIRGDRTLAGLGLDSLRSMELAHEIEDTFGIALETSDLFAAASLAELAGAVERAVRERAAPEKEDAGAESARAESAGAESAAPASEAPVSDLPASDCPVTAGQLALCFLHELDPKSTAYTIASALELEGPLDEAAFRTAWREVVRKHPSLRARIVRHGAEYRQHFDVPFRAIYTVTSPVSGDDAALGARLESETRRPFDLARGPLFRVHLVRTADRSGLLITAHHTIADLWSLSVVLQDLRNHYDGRIAAAPAMASSVASPAASPAEFAQWQRALIDGPAGERHLAFWREALADPPPALDLPTVRPRPSVATFEGALASFRVDPDVAAALRGFARERGVTLYTVLLAAFQTLVARLSGQTDVAVGAPSSGRTRSRFAGLVGYLVNPVVLRADLSGNPTFDDLVRDTAGGLSAALRHQDYPFATLVQRLAPPRDASRSPYFDVMFELRGVGDFVRGDLAAPGSAGVDLGRGLRGVTRPLPRRTSQFDLSVTATDLGDDLTIEYEYNTALFHRERIGEIAEAFRTLLAEAARRPEQRIARLPLLGPEARAAALGPAPAARPPERQRALTRRFEEHAARQPDTAAAIAGDRQVTYGDLNRRANALARDLRAAGVGKDARVGVVLPKSPELIVALIAVLKAGGAYVPVDPGLPPERRRFLLRDSGAVAVILGEGDAEARVPAFRVPPPAPGGDPGNLPESPHPDSLAYVIYTSGTTGVPKGVGVTHGNLSAATDAWDDAYDLTSFRIHLQVAAPGFDVFTGDLARALSSGGTLVLCDRDTLLEPEALAGLCRRHRPEFVDMLPATARALAAHVAASGDGPLDSFRILVVGADAWRMADYPLFRAMVGAGTRILNSYGVTETTVDNTYDDVTPEHADQMAPAIGRAMTHTAAYVLDGEWEPVPAGVRGELFLGGPAVSRGYIGRPDLTAERFLPDPHGEPGSRMYRTGDVVRRFGDGRLEFLGRADSQVKIRGQRVEPGEIESVLREHPDVRDVVVVAREDGAARRLVAYVVPRNGGPFDAATFRAFAQERVPAVLVPAAFVALPELPLSANGKVDRRRLPAPAWTDPAPPSRAPVTATESRIAALWRRVLDVPDVGPRDHFFELGGDSILVMQVVARAREEGMALSARAVFEHPVLAELARAVDAAGPADDGSAAPAGASPPAPAQGDCPLLPIQSWFFAQRFPNPDHWNLAVALDAREPLAIPAAEQAAAALLEHHEALRARFHRAGDTWRQTIPPPEPGRLHVPVAEFAGSADDAARTLGESLRLSEGPLIRFGIAGGSTFVIVAHHLVVDGVSLRILIEDFERFYRAAAAGVRPEPPRRTASVQEWGRRLAAAAPAAPAPTPDAVPAPLLPRDHPPSAAAEASTATRHVDLSPDETRNVVQAAATAGLSMETVLLAAVAHACAEWTGARSLRIETEGHGRDRLDLDVSRTVGWFTELRTVALRDVPADDPAELLRRAERALRERAPAAEAGPAAEISFNYLGRFEDPGAGSLFRALRIPDAPLRSPDAPRTHALEIDAMILDGRLRISTAYSTQEFHGDTVSRFTEALASALPVLRDAAAGPRGFVGPDRPLTPLQEGMLFHHLQDRDSDPYVAQIVFTLGGTVDPEALARAWQTAFDRHDALRAEFTWDRGHAPIQRIRAAADLPVTVHDVADGSREERMERIRRTGFDVSAAPLARLDLFPTGPDSIEVLFTHHHLLLDGWSLPRVLATVFGAYADHVSGTPPDTTPRDRAVLRRFAEWQSGRNPAGAEAFFRRTLDGFGSATPVPESAARPTGSSGSAVGHAPLPQDLAARARALGVTPNTVVQAAWALVLGACAGTRDVVFGVTSSGRSAPVDGLDAAVGLFINTLPLRARLDTGESVRPWLQALQRHAAELRVHEDASLAAVQRCAPLPPGTALFETLLVFENYPMDVDALRQHAPFPVLDFALHEETTYALTLVVEGQRDLAARVIYDRRRLDEGAVARVLDRLNRAIDALLEHPDAAVDSIVPLRERERAQLLEAGAGRAADYPREASVVAEFDRIAREHASAEALRFRDETFTYDEVRRRSVAIASALRARGLGPESRVALALDRSPEFVVAALGALRAGCAYVPLDPQSPAERSRRMIADARAALLITEATPRGEAVSGAEADVPAVPFRDLLESGAPGAAEAADLPGAGSVPADAAAYVMFTSGSTGEPKGIEVTHRNILNLVLAGDYLRFGAEQTVLHHSIVAFDATTFEIWGALLHGGRLVIAPPGPGSAAGLARLLDDHAVTAAFLTTGLFQVLAEEEPEALARVAQVLTGGDVMSPSAIRRIQEAGCRHLCHMYGPTETTTFATFDGLDPREDPGDRVPIGRPIANTRAYVLDASLRLCPVGAPGDLYVGGDGVSRGYVSRPDLTAERFVPDPFGPPGSRMYRTGDLARWRSDGRLEFLGRRDGQVKIRGFRVEVGEVEAALAALPGVHGAAVVIAGERGAAELVGYVVADPPQDPAALRSALAGKVPPSMVPARLQFLEELPLTPAGKIDRRALPRPSAPERSPAGSGAAAATPAEAALISIWRDVLGVPEIGPGDDFFELGGHSLHAMRVVARIRRTLDAELPLRALFDAPTVRGLARRLESAARPGASALVPASAEARRPASYAQSRMWFLDRLEPDSAAYNIAASLRFEGALDAAALEAALTEVVRRHEALRTRFREGPDGPEQIIDPARPVPIPVDDLEGWPAADREAEAARRVARLARRPFDLTTGPLLRAELLRIARDEHVLALSLHHIAADGWSIGVLARELAAAYRAAVRGEPVALPELPVQYADWAAWQREWLDDGALESQLAFWREALDGLPALSLPTDRPRPMRPTYAGATLPVRVDGDLVRRISKLAGAENTTLHMTLLAAFAGVLGRWSGQDDLGIGTPVANRTSPEAERLIGLFVNTLVLRARLDGPVLPFRDLLGRLREAALGAYAAQDVPFERVVEALQPDRDLSRTPLFQVMFILQNAPAGVLDLGDVRVRAFEAPTDTSTFDLTVSLEPGSNRTLARDDDGTPGADPDALEGAIEYSTELFDEATIRRLWSHTVRMLEAVVADPSRDVHGVPLLDEDDRTRALDIWSGRQRLSRTGRTVRERFEEHARRAPERVAAISGDRRVTYGEIDAHASAMAAELARRGIGPESRVGLCVPRGPELLVGMLAAWKAGAAYVPLDPDHPRDRVTFALEDAGVETVLVVPETADRVRGGGRTVLPLEDPAAPPPAGAPVPAHGFPGASATSLAYVIYTSGTTGRPKGVMIPQEAIGAAFDAWERLYGLDGIRSHLQMASVGFDVCTGDVVRALGSGGALVFCDRERLLDPRALFDLARREQVEFAEFVPAVLRTLVPHARRTGERIDSLRVVAVGSDAWTTAEVAAFRGVFGPDTRIANSYGVTEATVDSTCWFVPDGDSREASPPIGEPLTHATTYVLDGQLHPAPPGVLGELYLGGPGVGRGYAGRPDLTAERFVPDPFGEPGGRLYRTGDRARYRRDGQIVFAGRGDDQVKIRGQRVELAEVEAAVQSLPSVGSAAVLVRADGEGARLAAYVVPEPGPTFDPESARRLLRDRLPEAWIPQAFVTMPALPLTPNGKVDRRRLPEPVWIAAADYEPPATPAERAVAAAFAETLKVSRVGAGDDFFALGGHSLLAVRVISRLRTALGREIPVRTLFEHSGVRDLAAHLGRAADTPTESGPPAPAAAAPPPVRRAAAAERRRLSSAQWRLWFLDRYEPDSAAYHLATSIRMSGTLDVDALQRVLTEIVRRHEALRTRFAEGADGPEQIVEPAAPIALEVTDLTQLPDEQRAGALEERSRREARARFDLSRAPLLRAHLFRLDRLEHSLVVTVHHICADGWSLGVLLRELAELYTAFVDGRPSPLPELEVQYADWAAWQRDWLAAGEAERQLAHWRTELAGVPPIALPGDRPRPARPRGDGDSVDVRLDAPLRARLERIAREEGATLHMVLLAGYAAALARWSGQPDFAVGTPVANRRTEEAEPLIGFFVNTLALRLRLDDPGLTFRGLVAQVRQTSLTAHTNQDVPFERVVEELQPDRTAGHHPLFQVLFALQNAPVEAARLPGLSLAFDEPRTGTTRFDLELFLAESEVREEAEGRRPDGTPGALEGLLNYSTELFDRVTVERFLDGLAQLLETAAGDADRPLADLPALTPEQRHRVLRDWNAPDVPWTDPPLVAAFEEHAQRAPQAPALRFGDSGWTYGELDARANRLAHRFLREGAGPGAHVAICLERSFDRIAAVIAALKIGAAYVPIDPDYPPERNARLLRQAQAAVVVTTSDLAPRLPAALCLDSAATDLAALPATAPRAGRIPPDATAYTLFTSGSTGEPKGVSLTHRALENLLAWQRRESGGTPAPRTLQFTSLSFDVSFQEIFATLTAGGELVLIRDDDRRDPARLLDILERDRVERLFLPFVALHQLADAAVAGNRFPPGLREVHTAGEQLRITPEIRAFFTALPGCRLVNQYGPAETHVVTAYPLPGPAADWPELPPIGRPLPNAPVALLDARGQLVPLGASGELCVGGRAPARGYHGRPDFTAERFVPDAHSGNAGARLYRTGDVARFRSDGQLEFLGRRDFQVKIRGHRVEPGEIESALGRHPTVAQTCVQAFEHPGGARLCAYVVPAAGRDLAEQELRDHLAARLPGFMIPSAFVALDALPLTPSGKVDRKSLPAPDWTERTGDAAARTAEEEIVAGILADVLGLDRVGIRDDFFTLGGHSLLATRVLSRVRRDLGVEVPLRALFENPTAEGIAAAIDAARGRPALPPIRRAPEEARRRLSPAQQRLWFLHRLDPDSGAYNLPAAIRLEGDLDVEALEQALSGILDRHHALRTRIVEGPDGPEARVEEAVAVRLPVEARAAQSLAAALAEEASRPFVLSQAPMLRARLFRTGPRDHVLSLVLHHIAADGWSLGVLWRELGALYGAHAEGGNAESADAPLPDLPVQYADWAAWQHAWLDGGELDRQLEYWREALEGAPPALELPTDRARPDVASGSGATAGIRFPADLREGLLAIARAEGATLHMALLAGYAWTLMRWSDTDELVVGAPLANRRAAESEGLIGFFVNTLPLRIRLAGPDVTYRDLLRHVREVSLGAYAHQDVPFERIVEEIQPERSTRRAPVFQTAFALQDVQLPALDVAGLRMSPVETANDTAKFDLMLILGEDPDGLSGAFEYATDLFADETVGRIGDSLRATLAAAVAAPDAPLQRAPWLDDAEAARILASGSAVLPALTGRAGLAHAAFEAHAEREPDAPALLTPDGPIPYADAEARANRLAHHLRAAGAGPERRVAVLLERSPEAILAILAVLKSGAAYVPLEPADPPERLAMLIAGSGATIAVTDARLADGLAASDVPRILIDRDAERIAACPATRPDSGVRPGNLAYLIYTSGSTGGPKPVGVEHRSLAAYTSVVLERLRVEPGWRFALVSTLAADLGNTSLYAALSSGGSLLPVSPDDVLDAPRIAALFREHAIDALKIVPSHLAAWLAGQPPDGVLPRRLLVLGGEATSATLYRRLRAVAPDCRVANHYGPTETTVGTVAGFPEGADEARAALPLGRPLAGTSAYVLDRGGRPVPAGVPGELFLGGRGVSRGYLGRPELTAERFLPDPFGDEPGARMYRTGDRARWLPDGRLEFLGRRDAQIKIRGFRVEPGEVEAALLRHRDVDRAAVVVRTDDGGGRNLVAYVVPRPSASPRVGGLPRRRLPDNLALAELNRNETDYIHREVFGLQAYLRHGITLNDGDTVFDVGGNIGMFSVYASLVARNPRLFVFEPNPHLHPILAANLATYCPGATLLRHGLADREREAEFTFFPGFSLLSGLYADAATEQETVRSFLENQARAGVEGADTLSRDADALLAERFSGRGFRVSLRTLSDVLAGTDCDRIHLLKINVEKAELDVLRGIAEADWRRIDQAVVEIDLRDNLDPIRTLFESHGFDVHVEQDPLLERTDLLYLYAARRGSGRTLAPGAPPSAHPREPGVPFLEVEALRAQVAAFLPPAMVPGAWVFLESLPVTANGKLDRRRLPAPEAERRDVVAPRGERQRAVARIWAEVLGRKTVGVHDNFFDLGGHSLLLAQVHARLRAELHAELSVVELFRYPTVAALAARLDAAPAGSDDAAAHRARGSERRAAARARAARRLP